MKTLRLLLNIFISYVQCIHIMGTWCSNALKSSQFVSNVLLIIWERFEPSTRPLYTGNLNTNTLGTVILVFLKLFVPLYNLETVYITLGTMHLETSHRPIYTLWELFGAKHKTTLYSGNCSKSQTILLKLSASNLYSGSCLVPSTRLLYTLVVV